MTGGVNNRLQPVGPQRPTGPPSRTQPATGAPGFAEVLHGQLQGKPAVRLSAHAEARLEASRRQLSPQQLSRIAEAVDQVQAKGGRESLFLLDNLALVVSVPNRTVITAVTDDRMRENVFTNIDSAVIL